MPARRCILLGWCECACVRQVNEEAAWARCDTQHGAMRAARRALRRLTCPRHGSRPRDIAKEAAAAAAAACARTGIRPRPNTAHGARRTGCRHSPHTARPRGPASAAARLVCAPARPSVSVGTHLMLPATWAGLCAHAGCRLRGTARASARPRRRMQRQNSACMSARARVHTRAHARTHAAAALRACVRAGATLAAAQRVAMQGTMREALPASCDARRACDHRGPRGSHRRCRKSCRPVQRSPVVPAARPPHSHRHGFLLPRTELVEFVGATLRPAS